MTRMNSQTKIIVATACALAVVDIAVRLFAPTRTIVVRPGGASVDTLTVRTLHIVDNNGESRVTLNVDDSGEPGMVMRDRNGINRLQLDTWQNTPSLILNTRDGNRSVYFGMENGSGQGLYQSRGATVQSDATTTYVMAGDPGTSQGVVFTPNP